MGSTESNTFNRSPTFSYTYCLNVHYTTLVTQHIRLIKVDRTQPVNFLVENSIGTHTIIQR